MAHPFSKGHSAPKGNLRIILSIITKKCENLIKSVDNFTAFYEFYENLGYDSHFTLFCNSPNMNSVQSVIKFRGKYRVQSARLKSYDYSQSGAYFVTICTKDRDRFFGESIEGKMQYSEIGMIVQQCWLDISDHFRFIVLGEWVVMPNHVHGILFFETHDVETRDETQYLASSMLLKKHPVQYVRERRKILRLYRTNHFLISFETI